MVTLHLFNLLMSYLLILNDQLKSARDVKGFGVCERLLYLASDPRFKIHCLKTEH